MSTPSLTLYTCATPNGHKVSTALEILNLSYKVQTLSLAKNEQKEEWFLKINPNGRVPALVDHSKGDFPVFESGAILLYLADNYDPEHKLLPSDPKLRSEAIQWMGGVGPMLGQAAYFLNYAPEKVPYAIKRYTDESLRLLSVIEARLQGKEYLVGNQLTLAELSLVPWVRAAPLLGLDESAYPKTKAWVERTEQNTGFAKGLDVPEKDSIQSRIAQSKLAKEQAVEAAA